MINNMHLNPKESGVYSVKGMSPHLLEKIMALVYHCQDKEHNDYETPLNLSMLRQRDAEQYNDFLYYDQGILVGFLGLYSFVNPQEAEVFGLVHPAYRRNGIGKALFRQGCLFAQERGITRLLLIVEGEAIAGSQFVKAIQADYAFSEYKLIHRHSADFTHRSVDIRLLTEDDIEDAVLISTSCFGSSATNDHNFITSLLRDDHVASYVAIHEEQAVGIINVRFDEGNAFVFSFAVLPDFQRRGIGRSVLHQTVQLAYEGGASTVILEVNTENEHALELYKTCGFMLDRVYRYYSVCLD